MKRIPLTVIARCDEDGAATPIAIEFGGRRYAVQKILSVTRHAPEVACLSPLRYDCVIDGRKKSIYRDSYPSLRWFSVRR